MSEFDPAEYAVLAVPTRQIFKHNHRHALFKDFEEHHIVEVSPLQQMANGSWLVSVEGRVYEMTRQMMERCVQWSEDSDLYQKLEHDEADTTVEVSDAGRYENVYIGDEMIASYEPETGELCFYDPHDDSEDAALVTEVRHDE